jgi:thiamine biosynthesis lipoprotein
MLAANQLQNKPAVHQRDMRLMGNRFQISVVCDNAVTAQQHIDAAVAEIQRI